MRGEEICRASGQCDRNRAILCFGIGIGETCQLAAGGGLEEADGLLAGDSTETVRGSRCQFQSRIVVSKFDGVQALILAELPKIAPFEAAEVCFSRPGDI